MKNQLHLYSVMPLDLEHADEICKDVAFQQEQGISTCALFCMTLTPEGNPPIDKAAILAEKYKVFREKLREKKIRSGVLIQASIGHGWILGELFPYQRYVNMKDGEAVNVVCPYDEGFKEYIYNGLKTIAACKPDHIMVDDDLRLMYRDGRGCGCPLHIKRFNELAGTNFTREQLWEKLSSGTEEGKKYEQIFVETQRESILGVAKKMREGIDSVDETIPGSFCAVGNNMEFGYEVAKTLAGKGNPIVVRANNGAYTPAGARNLSLAFQRIASQMQKLKGKADVVLAETDTCPQNRYSTGAMSLHSHFTGSILEGANGAKHWITRLDAYEPESGKAYRKVLSKYKGFYEALAEIVPALKWRGFRIPVSKRPVYDVGNPDGRWVGDEFDFWSLAVLERFGLPLYFSAEKGGIACFSCKADAYFTDEELLETLKGNVILAVESAEALIRRGFQEYIGVDVKPWTGKTPTHEFVNVNGNKMPVQMQTKQLIALSGDVKEDSVVCHSIDKEHFEKLFPGSVVYKNKLGGTVVTFCGTPKANFMLTEAFSFLNYSRKQQFIRLLKELGESPVYYPGDQEIYLKAADTEDGLFCAAFNISLDPIDRLELCIEGEVKKIEKLLPDGSRAEVPFEKEDDKYLLQIPCNILDPVILFIAR